MLADRHGIKTLPTIIVFQKNSSSPILFEGNDVTFISLGNFAKEHTGFYMRGAGNIEVFDKLAQRFSKGSVTERDVIISDAENAITSVKNSEAVDAEYYVKVT